MKRIVFCLVFVSITTLAIGQKCKKYHKRNCYSYGYPFVYSSQSQDFKLYSMQTIEIDIMVMAGYEYNVSLAFDDLLGEVIFQIADASKTIIYYNSQKSVENIYNIQFAVDETKKLKVLIIVPDSKIRNVKYGLPRCGGLMVEYNKQPKLGF